MQETQVQFLGWEDTLEIPWRRNRLPIPVFLGFPGGSDGKESTCNVGDLGWIPGLGRSSGGGHGNPLQYCLENPHGQRSLASYSPWGCRELDMTEQLSTAQPHVRQWMQYWPSLGTQLTVVSLLSLSVCLSFCLCISVSPPLCIFRERDICRHLCIYRNKIMYLYRCSI